MMFPVPAEGRWRAVDGTVLEGKIYDPTGSLAGLVAYQLPVDGRIDFIFTIRDDRLVYEGSERVQPQAFLYPDGKAERVVASEGVGT